MRLDVIVPTYNRHDLLQRTLQSLLDAKIPDGLSVTVTVVDNNSTDATRDTVEAYQPRFAGRLKYVFEARQGRSKALNAGIAATDGDLVGMIDDDEEIDKSWFCCIHELFSTTDVDFIGGPYVPDWGAPVPPWLPAVHAGVLGAVDGGSQAHVFGSSNAILMGGNAIISRKMLNQIGAYSEDLGRTGELALADEDTDMYLRLLAAGAKGMYVPDLIIYHYIHPERLTKRYFRRWHFWRGVSSGVLDRKQPKQAAYLLGIPRYLFGRAARAAVRMPGTLLSIRKNPAQHFSDELKLWDVAGFFYGKHFYRPIL